jgi:parvulin-like peptidyl-prolyl isomerase
VEALASVNGEPITLDDLLQQIGALHEGVEEPAAMVEKPDPRALLERLIGVRLVLQEARNIGLDELPEMTRQVAAARLDLLKEAVIEERLKEFTRGDPDQVDVLYRDAVREVRVESVLFPSAEAAASFLAALEAGAEFGEKARALVDGGEALAHQPPDYLRTARLEPEVRAAVGRLEPGATSPPIPLSAGVTVLRLLDVRYAEDPAARQEAERQGLERRRQIALTDYARELRSRYARVDEALVSSLDYDGPEAGLEALRTDRRVVAEILGGEPITVGELTARMEQRMFHGLERAAQQQRAGEAIPGTLDRIIQERAVVLEANRLGVPERPAFRSALQAREDGLLFGRFLSTVIDPSVKVPDAELRAFHAEHRADYSSPEMMRIRSLVFRRRQDAQAALEKLRQGADLEWMRANAAGQVDPQDVDPEWRFDGKLVPVPALPEGARGAVAGAAAGDYRFCEQPGGGPFHVLWVTEAFPSRPQEYEAVKQQIARRVAAQKRQRALEEWIGRLREASEVRVFVDDGQLRALLGLAAAEGA